MAMLASSDPPVADGKGYQRVFRELAYTDAAPQM